MTESPRPEPLRIGLLVDSLEQPAWVIRALERTLEAGTSRVGLIVRNAMPVAAARRGPSGRVRAVYRNRRYLLHGLYRRLDNWWFGTNDDPFAFRPLGELAAGVPLLDVVPRMTRFSDFLHDADVDAIRDAELDVLVRFGFRILRGRVLSAARYGVWSYHHGDNRVNRGGPAGFWEVMLDQPTTGTVLQVLTEDLDAGRVIYRSNGATNRYSVNRNRRDLYWRSAEFLSRKLRDAAVDGSRALEEDGASSTDPVAYDAPLYRVPTNRELVPHLARLARRYVGAQWSDRFGYQQWFLAWARRKGRAPDSREPEMVPYRFTPIIPPADRFWADPFPARHEGRDFVFLEEYIYGSGKGHIALLELGEKGPVGVPEPVLREPHHLSYPFLFAWRGAHFLLPESAAARRVEVYRAVRFPTDWTLETVFFDDAVLVDSTLALIGNRWWLFANAEAGCGSLADELHVFFGNSPLGPWTPHRRNPVISDVRRSRPAGGLFERGGRWYRPAQDSSRGYGSGVSLQRIVTLDEREYVEEAVAQLLPHWAPSLRGVHTINALGDLTMLDAKRQRRRLPWSVRGR